MKLLLIVVLCALSAVSFSAEIVLETKYGKHKIVGRDDIKLGLDVTELGYGFTLKKNEVGDNSLYFNGKCVREYYDFSMQVTKYSLIIPKIKDIKKPLEQIYDVFLFDGDRFVKIFEDINFLMRPRDFSDGFCFSAIRKHNELLFKKERGKTQEKTFYVVFKNGEITEKCIRDSFDPVPKDYAVFAKTSVFLNKYELYNLMDKTSIFIPSNILILCIFKNKVLCLDRESSEYYFNDFSFKNKKTIDAKKIFGSNCFWTVTKSDNSNYLMNFEFEELKDSHGFLTSIFWNVGQWKWVVSKFHGKTHLYFSSLDCDYVVVEDARYNGNGYFTLTTTNNLSVVIDGKVMKNNSGQ